MHLHYFWGDVNTCLLTLPRELTRNQSKNITSVQCGKLLSLLGLFMGMGGELLQEQKSLNGSCITESPPHRGWQLTKPGNK